MQREASFIPTLGRVMVTGGCGFIGRSLVARLAARGCEVTVVDDLSTGSADFCRECPAGVRCYEGSVTNLMFLEDILHDCRPQLVFHLASLVGVRLTANRPSETYRVSCLGTANLLRASPGVPIVLFSSSAVYGHCASDFRPDDLSRAALAYDGGVPGYASGKLAAEQLCLADARPVLIVRPFNIVGPGQSDKYGMVLPAFVRRALAGEPAIIYDDGRQERTFGAVDTFLSALLRLVSCPAAWSSRRAYDLGSNRPISILGLARLVSRVCGCDHKVEHRPYAAEFPGKQDVRRRLPDLIPIKALTGPLRWPPLEQIVHEMVVYYRGEGAHCVA